MKLKPYTGPTSVESVFRSIVDALTGNLTLRDNAAVESMAIIWNSDFPQCLIRPARMPRAIVILRAHRVDRPAAFASGGAVYWEPTDDGNINLTGMSSLSGSVDWAVDLLLVED